MSIIVPEYAIVERRSHHYSLLHRVTQMLICKIINDYITSDNILEMEDACTEYGLPKIWVKLAHAKMADTRLSSSPPCMFLESLVMRLNTIAFLPIHVCLPCSQITICFLIYRCVYLSSDIYLCLYFKLDLMTFSLH